MELLNKRKTLKLLQCNSFKVSLAEKEGFEPSRPFRSLHDFQSCALDQLGDFSIAVPVRSAYELDLSSDSFIIIAKDGKMSTPKNKIF